VGRTAATLRFTGNAAAGAVAERGAAGVPAGGGGADRDARAGAAAADRTAEPVAAEPLHRDTSLDAGTATAPGVA
jgi:hypothetical protein